MIKDELTAEQLEKSVNKSLQELHGELEQKDELAYRKDMLKNKEIWKRQFSKQLLGSNNPEEIMESARRLGIEWRHSHFMLAMGCLNYASFPRKYRYSDSFLMLYGISNIAGELVCDGLTVTTLTDSESRFLCVANFQPDLHRDTVLLFDRYLASLKSKIREFLKIDVSIVYSPPFKGGEQTKKQYGKLMRWNKQAFYSSDRFGMLPAFETRMWPQEVHGIVSSEWERIAAAFKERDEASVFQALDELQAKAMQYQPDPEELLSKCSQWIRVLELEGNHPGDDVFHSCLKKCTRLDEVIEVLRMKLQDLIQAGQANRMIKSPKLRQIEKYITDRLSDNITLIDMANHLNLNSSYFSRYFKQETGMNFTDYVHSFKMKLACSLLKEKQESIEMIAFRLGYMERTYFSKVFKKYVGISPKDYEATEKVR
ncbi:helix-turn-helix domain-containing protein [Paenibacillus sp. TAB 01]|uniref:helix-turn-helix domain-containing protein n=1 Tax=Paenibacillus sp. TAB 01 TaxID=3368988 RepID=UPI003751D5BB